MARLIPWLCVFLLLPLGLQSATYTWDGGGDGTTWTDANNWDLDSSYPGFDAANNDVAIIGGGFSVSLGTSANIATLQIADTATLTLNGSGPKLTVVTAITVNNIGATSQAVIQGVGSITTGGGNNATTITVSNAADSLKIKSLELLNGTSSC
ncbi:MAG: hypothetical protein AB7F75_10685, partial [Planctomycetota bacterium]